MKKARSQWSIGVLGYWSIAKTKRHYSITPLLLFIYLLLFTAQSLAIEISAVNVKMQNNDIYVTTSLKPDSKFMDDMNNGLSKEFTFYIDLFRVWSIWPDEFVTGRKLVKILKSNPIKREYIAASVDGNVQVEKRFKDLESMVEWAMNIIDIKLTNIKELEPGEYFVKITVDSRIRKLPPVIGYFLFFVPEKEFSISKDSQIFKINPKNSP
ncbi:DUF4390 domain-containing protein [Dissulfurispira sp.]|uniref:DUF4390 domain-containing protein n=1 Tax=Dissulfurispira sp. TaxID=2817609 RepID=UPI002FDB66A1